MTSKIEALLNDVATELLLLSEDNKESDLDGIGGGLEKLIDACASEPTCDRLSQSVRHVIGARKTITADAWIILLNGLLSQAQIYLKNPQGAVFPGEKEDQAPQDMSANVDPQFLIEFIEKHNGMMDEFESAIVDMRYKLSEHPGEEVEEARGDFEAYAKGYIHNVKGDAGSIGLIGIEKACHFVEDRMVELRASDILDALIAFKEWVVACMRSFSKNENVAECSAGFCPRFAEMCRSAQTEPSAGHAASGVSGRLPAQDGGQPGRADDDRRSAEELSKTLGEDLPPEANLDLLAELLGESGVVQAPQVQEPAAVEAELAPAPAKPAAANGVPSYSITGDMEVFAEFCVEAEDHISIIESILLESDGNYSKDNIDSIFRGIHSIKGASSYFGLREVTETSHKTETLLDEVRDGKRQLDQSLADLVLAYVDLEHRLLETAKEAAKRDGRIEGSSLTGVYLDRLHSVQSGSVPVKLAAAAPSAAAKGQTSAAPDSYNEIPRDKGSEEEKVQSSGKGEKLEVKNFVKIDTQRLDLLIDSIGEMCIYSSMLVQSCRELLGDNERILKTSHQVEKFSRDLQNIGMSMRLIPIRGLFQKMSRLVWDMSKKIGKEVKFQMCGEETELDRSIIDKLADPLMHMVRNSLDHGVEPPDEREKAGKPRAGTVTLSAAHAGGSIHIRVEDDGRGLNPEKICKKAIEKSLIPENHNLSRDEIFHLIFAPGFSTAAVVTDISGRGVGMDVVKRNIESMRGRVHIESEIGKGASFLIELPLTLAIIDGILVSVGGENYIVPTLSIIEFMRPAPSSITRTLDRGETYQFRGRYMPVYRLAQLFGIETSVNNPEDSTFIIVESGGEQVALMVDQIVSTYSTVIKSLGDMFDQGKGVAGCAIMANGDVALILDVRSLIQMAKSSYVFTSAVLA